MRTCALIVTLGLALALGCGGDDASPAPPPGDGGAGGGGGSGGGGDPGGGGGDTSGGGGDTGGGEAGGGGAPGASSDGTVRFERLDESGECDVLVPARMPDAIPIETGSDACAGAVSDGSGHVAVAASVSTRNRSAVWDVYTSAGARVGTFVTEIGGLHPQPEGFQGLQVTGRSFGPIAVDVVTFSGSGVLRRTERATPPDSERATVGWLQVKDALGGAALVHFGRTPDGSCVGVVSRYDDTGAPRGRGTYGTGGDCRALAAAVSSGGEALVVEESAGASWLWWIAADGRLARPPARVGSFATAPGPAPFLQPLIDGSIVANEGGAWTRRFAHLGDRSEPAPAWLSSRPGYSFENTRGARGYALFPPIERQGDDCSKQVDLVAPSGRLCGRLTLAGEGGTCRPSFVGQGWDGTVIQQRLGCRVRIWPRLLAGD